jgi:catechol 2,3-dioxygenase-like lactoylglutathione lyase family enzyme
MSTNEVRNDDATVARVDMKFEVVVIPVSDADRAKEFYGRLGWRLDADFNDGHYYRVIQFTPPGSGCSVIFGKNVTAAAPGSAQGLYLVVSDIEAARYELAGRGVDVSDVFHDGGGVYDGTDQPYIFGRLRVSGLDPEHRSYKSFVSFSDPDGNGWLLQEIRERLPGRGVTIDVADLAKLLQETAEHHGSFEAIAPRHDWWDWYAAYMDARERGRTAEEAAAAARRYMAEAKHIVVSPA